MSDIIERLKAQARRESEVSRMMAEEKSRRQADNLSGECVYSWLKPEETTSWAAAETIFALREAIKKAELHIDCAHFRKAQDILSAALATEAE